MQLICRQDIEISREMPYLKSGRIMLYPGQFLSDIVLFRDLFFLQNKKEAKSRPPRLCLQ